MNRSDANLFLEPLMPGHPVFDYPKGEDAERFLEKFGVCPGELQKFSYDDMLRQYRKAKKR